MDKSCWVRRTALTAFSASVLGLSACHQPQQAVAERTITVIGQATVKREPELFTLEGMVKARAESRADTLEALSDTLNELRDELPNLRGLEGVTFTTDDMQVEPVLPFGCDTGFGGEPRPSDCSPIAHEAFIPFSVVGAPYQVAGDAASLLAEKGADTVNVTGFTVRQPEALRAEARRQAVIDGLQTAQELATGAGERLGPLMYLNTHTSGATPYAVDRAPEELVVTSLRVSPAAPIRLTPDDIEITERVELVISLLDQEQ